MEAWPSTVTGMSSPESKPAWVQVRAWLAEIKAKNSASSLGVAIPRRLRAWRQAKSRCSAGVGVGKGSRWGCVREGRS